MKDIYQALDELNIKFEKVEHPAVFTCAEAEHYDRGIDAGKCKNLFLRNKRGDKNYLVILPAEKRLDLKSLAEKLSEEKLSFASAEKLEKYLGLTAGSVSPFGLINDVNKEVIVVIDNDLSEYSKLGLHPNVNTATLIISYEFFIKFLDWTGNKTVFINLNS